MADLPLLATPPLSRRQLASGLRLVMAESREVPSVTGWLLIRAGAELDPPDQVGLAEMTATLVGEGGIAGKNRGEVDAILRRLGARIWAESSPGFATIQFQCMAGDLEAVLELVGAKVAAPAFAAEAFEEIEAKMRGQIGARNKSNEASAEREFLRIVYQDVAPFGRVMEYEHLEHIEREHVVEFHRRYYLPANSLLVVEGDFSSDALAHTVESAFARWTSTGPEAESPVVVAGRSKAGIYWGDRPGTEKAYFVIGQLVRGKEEDRAALDVMAEILNRGLLTWARVRTGRSMDVSLATRWEPTSRMARTLQLRGSVNPSAATEVIGGVLSQMQAFRPEVLTDDLVAQASQRVITRLILEHDRAERILRTASILWLEGSAEDALVRYQKAVVSVTRNDVARVLREYLRPGELTITGVGNLILLSRPLAELNLPVNRLDLAIPEPKAFEAKADPESIEKGREWLGRVQEALGGGDKLAAVRDYMVEAGGTLRIGTRTVPARATEQWIADETYRQDQQLAAERHIIFYNGKIGWVSDGSKLGPLTPPQVRQIRGELFRLLFRLAISDRIEGRLVSYQGSGVIYIGGANDQHARMYVDEETWLPRRLVYLSVGPDRSAQPSEVTYEDWREVDGIKLPFRFGIKVGDSTVGEFTVSQAKVNSGLKIEDVERKPQ